MQNDLNVWVFVFLTYFTQTMQKPLTVWITTNWKILQEMRILKEMTTWPTSWEICMQVKKQQLEPDMEQQTGSK